MKFIEYKLSELGEIVGGSTPFTKNESYYGGDIPWLTPKDLANFNGRYINFGERNITEAGYKSTSVKMLPINSVLFSSRAPIGYVAINNKNEVCTNQGFKSVIPNSKTDYMFLYYLLKYNKNKIEAMGSGTTFKEVSSTVMKNIIVNVPEAKEDQIKIGKILSKIDDKIELNTQTNDNLYEIGKNIYEDLFSKLNENNSKEYRLEEILDILKDGTHNPPARIENGVPLITGQTLQNGFIGYDKMTYISVGDYKKIHSKYQPQINDLIITKIGTVGKVAILRECDIPITVHCNSAMLRFKKEFLTQFYGFWMLMSKDFITEFNKRISRTVQDFVSLGKMAEIPIKVPNYEIMKEYDEVFRTILTKISHINFENKTLIQLRDTLLPKLMNGEIDLDKIKI